MRIYINNIKAVVKNGSTIEYNVENRAFTNADGYTLNIVFPLRNCEINRQIFGNTERLDINKEQITYDAKILDKNLEVYGTLALTEITENEIKGQFLQGKSASNYKSAFDDIYINELDLGFTSNLERNVNEITAENAMKDYDNGRNYIAVPFVNNTTGNLLNDMIYDENANKTVWAYPYIDTETDAKKNNFYISWFPYLIWITKKIFEEVGYTCNFEEWENNPKRFLVIFQNIPAVWQASGFELNWKYCLPHWSINEFIKQLEYILWADIDIEQANKSVNVKFKTKESNNDNVVFLTQVIDEYTTELTEDDESEFMDNYDLEYNTNEDTKWNQKSCEWYIRLKGQYAKKFATLADLITWFSTYKKTTPLENIRTDIEGNITYGTQTDYANGIPEDSDAAGLFYVTEIDTYFIAECYKIEVMARLNGRNWYYHYYRLMVVNEYGNRIIKKDNNNKIEFKIIPARTDEISPERGKCVFCTCGEIDNLIGGGINISKWSISTADEANAYGSDYLDGAILPTAAERAIEQGEKDGEYEFFTNIQVGYWDNNMGWKNCNQRMLPIPVTEKLFIIRRYTSDSNQYSQIFLNTYADFRINKNNKINIKTSIEATQKYTFKFISSEIPDVNSLFIIRGKKYICSKITATFTENGMSQLLKGEFYKCL